jgi:transposase
LYDILEQRRDDYFMPRRITKYTKEEKDILVARLFPPENISLGLLANETGISKSTLSTWKKNAEETKGITKPKRNLTPNDKFLIVMETYSLTEIELSRYCREKGLYYDELKKWSNICVNSNNNNANDSDDIKELKASKQEDSKRIRELEKELNRKEKALAEAAALLLLRKKLQAILVENAED